MAKFADVVAIDSPTNPQKTPHQTPASARAVKLKSEMARAIMTVRTDVLRIIAEAYVCDFSWNEDPV